MEDGNPAKDIYLTFIFEKSSTFILSPSSLHLKKDKKTFKLPTQIPHLRYQKPHLGTKENKKEVLRVTQPTVTSANI